MTILVIFPKLAFYYITSKCVHANKLQDEKSLINKWICEFILSRFMYEME